MNKGVTLRAQVSIVDTPTAPDDPATVAQGIITQVFAAGIQASANPYRVAVQRLAALTAPSATTPATSPSVPGAPPAPGAATPAAQSAARGASMSVQLYVEGDAPPADDFAQIGQSVVTRIFAAGVKVYTGPYILTLGPVLALEGSDADDEDSDGSGDSSDV
jgi:hypothetical protein